MKSSSLSRIWFNGDDEHARELGTGCGVPQSRPNKPLDPALPPMPRSPARGSDTALGATMNRITYFRVAAFLPVLMPAVLVPFFYFTGLLDTMLGAPLMILFDAALIFGLPYLAAASLTLMLLGHASERAYARFGLAAPFIFALVVSGIALFHPRASGVDLHSLAFLGGVSLAVGYLYVAIAFAGLVILKGFGVIRETVARS